jgi:hypothetical protein
MVILGDDGVVPVCGWGAPTTATLASSVLADSEGEVHRSLSLCIVDDPLTEGGVTEGGVSGERRDAAREASVLDGREMNIFDEVDRGKEGFDGVAERDEEPSSERRLLFEATVRE